MKSKHLLLTLLLALLVPWAAMAQATHTVYDVNVNEVSQFIPLYAYSGDTEGTTSEFIIPADDLSALTGKTITKLTFYLSEQGSKTWTATYQVYLKEVEATILNSNYGPDACTVVYTGPVNGQVDEMTIEFNDNYTYNGGNLLIGTYVSSAGAYDDYGKFYGTEVEGAAYMSGDWGGYSTGEIDFIPKTTFTYLTSDPYITLDPTSATVITGFTQTLTATVGNVTGTPTITYESNDTHVATVDGSGTTATVTGVAPGTCTITATMNYQGTDYTATCAITVEEPSLCSPTFSNPSDDYISNFTTTGGVTNISNSSTYETGGYSDYYDTQSASIEAGETLSCTVTPSSTQWTYGNAIWVDWNGDFVFANNERVAYSAVVSGEWTGEFAVPATTAAGDYHMRVMHYYNTAATDPCISANYGEAEDYKLTVLLASSCSRPSDLIVSEIGKRSAKLSWTENGEATAWQICLNGDEDHLIDADTNPYTLTGLDPETDYTVKVRANCSSEPSNWTDEIPFTTEVACPAPTIGTIDVAPRSATVNWTGFAEGYTLEYALLPAAKDPYSNDDWYYYDNGTFATPVGLGGGEFHWGVMFPAGSFEGDIIDVVRAYDITPMVGTLAIYNDGATAPANQLSIQDIEFTGANAWVEFNTNVTIDPTKNVWVVFDAVDGAAYPMGTSIDDNGDANGRWVEISGTWYDLANVGVSGKTNMIRAHFINIDPSTLTWATVDNVTSPHTINNLLPETKYVVRMKANCGNDGESEWSSIALFITDESCPAPTNLTATNVAYTTAQLSWQGTNDSYNVHYRAVPAIFFDGFENGLDNWTTYHFGDENTNTYWQITQPANWGGTVAAHGGDNVALSRSYYNNASYNIDNWLVTPQVTLDGTLKFWVYGSSSWPEEYEVYVSTTGNAVADFGTTPFFTPPTITSSWVEVVVDLSQFNGAQGYIALRNHGSDKDFMWIDDFGIYNAGAWESLNTTSTSIELTDLEPGITYQYQVRGYCTYEETWTDWTTMAAFTTLPPVTYTLDIAGFGDGNISWYLISSPIGAVNPTNVENMLKDNADEYDLYAFDQAYPQEEWRNYKSSNFILEPGKGYLYANQDNVTLTFTGEPYTGNGEVTLVKDETAYPDMVGWNLVGNPFGETAYIDRPFYVMNAGRWKVIAATTEAIQPMQGIFVYAADNGETMTFSTTMPAKSANLALNLSQNSNVVDRAIVNFDGERSLPKFQINESSTKVYIPMEDQDYAVVSAGNVGELPVSFKAESNGSYTLNFTSQEVSFSYLHLIDNMTGDDVNLLETPYYTFNAQTTDYASRFRLVFATGSSVDGDNFAFVNGMDNLCIFGIEGEASVQVMDALGRMVSSNTFSGSYEQKLNVAPGVYMIRLINGNDVKVQKMVIR